MLEVMLRTLIVGAFATLAAILFERGFAHLRVGTRFAWTFALLATVVLPFVPQLMQSSPVLDVVPVIVAPGMVVSATSQIESRFPINPLVAAWLFLSTVVLLTYLVSYVRLRRARQGWLPAQVARRDVFMSERFGPAVFGFVAPQIVVPKWVRDAERDEQELIVLHESEHIRARDQLQLLLAICATIVMPWNPLVWIHTRRLRFAIEADCDQRVLAAAPDRARYASLLVNVGAKQNGLLLTPALAEHGNGLEARLNMLARKLIQNRWKAAGMLAVGLVLTALACESRLPQEAEQTAEQAKVVERPLLREGYKVLDDGVLAPKPDPQRARSASIMEAEYPPLLRDAGITGTVGLRLHVTAGGAADQVVVTRSSGHEALDQAAVRVAKRFEWGRDGKDYWTTTSLTFGKNAQTMEVVMRPTMREDRSLPRKIDQAQEPHFTPFTKRPEVANRSEVVELLKQNYPPELKNAGVGGTVLAWVLIDSKGQVLKTKLKETSGNEVLDAAGLKVVEQMKFLPAEHEGNPVNVWIQLPIVFKTQ